jgi:hypothetical protein
MGSNMIRLETPETTTGNIIAPFKIQGRSWETIWPVFKTGGW